MTEKKNTSIRKSSELTTPKQAATISNAEKVDVFQKNTQNTNSKAAKAPIKGSDKKKKGTKKPTKFKKSPTLHRLFQYIEKNVSLSTFIAITALILIAVFLLGTIAGIKIRSKLEEKQDRQEEIRQIETYIKAASEEFGIPYDLIYAVIKTESDFQADAVSSVGARGLMQIMPGQTLDHINELMNTNYQPKDLFDPEINIRLGTRYLLYLYNYNNCRFQNVDETIYAAYNAGPGRVEKWLNDPNYSSDGITLIHDKIPIAETKRYVEKVKAFREDYLASQE